MFNKPLTSNELEAMADTLEFAVKRLNDSWNAKDEDVRSFNHSLANKMIEEVRWRLSASSEAAFAREVKEREATMLAEKNKAERAKTISEIAKPRKKEGA